MIDPSSPDLAARVLESLASLGKHIGDPAVDRGVQYLRRTQEADGSWFGRWGVNYIYGTWQALSGLAAVGIADFRSNDGRRGTVADYTSATLRRMGRIGRQLRRSKTPRPGARNRLANRMGIAGSNRRRHARSSGRCPWRAVSARPSEHRWHVGRNRIHRHRLPARVLFAIPLLPHLLPA